MDILNPAEFPLAKPASRNSRAWFLDELDIYQTEKPYRLRFESPDPSIARTNTQSTLTTEDAADEQKVKQIYLQSLKPVLRDFFRTPNVVILEYVIRKREESFPISHGGDHETNQPVLVAHVDWTPRHVESRVRRFMGAAKAEKILSGRYQYVDVWKPLKGLVRDWPLALRDLSSIDPDKDLEMADTVFDIGEYEVQQNYQMNHRPQHRWFYLSEQKTDEITIFRQYDSEIGHGSGVPHVALPDPSVDSSAELRGSIEVQCLVYWDSV
ncbi:uncharacterized protein LY89DRAFT_732386 [Mollisia scopiformis]|uniref:Uncharacterized protein n=1 Tax=Mollisia scopiformis TaxID=149040 RepID=A0A194XFD3_MOLSC|nr:uncharacterized protein LY89DRAFT_732386 [Mollisia scopiformis]KUJ18844.1 hypothetical protein LY89DRAFT_732386 [Mollisia scopiformis]